MNPKAAARSLEIFNRSNSSGTFFCTLRRSFVGHFFPVSPPSDLRLAVIPSLFFCCCRQPALPSSLTLGNPSCVSSRAACRSTKQRVKAWYNGCDRRVLLRRSELLPCGQRDGACFCRYRKQRGSCREAGRPGTLFGRWDHGSVVGQGRQQGGRVCADVTRLISNGMGFLLGAGWSGMHRLLDGSSNRPEEL